MLVLLSDVNGRPGQAPASPGPGHLAKGEARSRNGMGSSYSMRTSTGLSSVYETRVCEVDAVKRQEVCKGGNKIALEDDQADWVIETRYGHFMMPATCTSDVIYETSSYLLFENDDLGIVMHILPHARTPSTYRLHMCSCGSYSAIPLL